VNPFRASFVQQECGLSTGGLFLDESAPIQGKRGHFNQPFSFPTCSGQGT
jgi:hypothetical protein